MRKAKEENIVTFHPNLARAFKGFVPVFGNDEDRLIVLAMNKLHGQISKVNNKAFREFEKTNSLKRLTTKMKDIQYNERNLEKRIIKSNLDF